MSQPSLTSETFADRARELVAFLAEAPPGAVIQRQQERELADWISRWQRALGSSRAQHFLAEELGIIMRALSGPPPNAVRWQEGSNERMCWLIARCMAEHA
ncbi:MAG TPA: hypothetical protein VF169_26710 [Albitalea sp.]|uniref:hypothetical protein n=1 Tax=Piscinibacter sp. TaxID=1903157 RepID=UPI002ED6B136